MWVNPGGENKPPLSEFWSTFPEIRAGLDQIRGQLRQQAELLPPDLRDEFKPLVHKEGKLLRAGLVLLSAGTCAPDRRGAVESAAAAVELLHLATLVHDDVIDQASLRRGEPAFHRKVGTQKAVLYGDFLFAACFRSVGRDVGQEAARSLADLVTVMAVSEIQQLNDRFRLPVEPRHIRRKTMGKTALLFSLCLYIGAVESRRSEATAGLLRRAGYSLGMAFQLQDDLLDWTGDPGVLGKSVLEDLEAGIYTWPVVLAWQADPELTRRELTDVREGRLSAQALRDRWMNLGLWAGTDQVVGQYVDRVRRDLDRALGIGSRERLEWNRFLELLLRRQR